MIRLVLVAGLCAGLLLAACGGGDDDNNGDDASAAPTTAAQQDDTPAADADPTEAPDDAASGAVDPCGLISPEDAAAAVGGPTDEPQRSFIGEMFEQCVYRIEGGTEIDSAVVIQARGGTSEDDFERLVDASTPQEVGEVTTVDGLGDRAYQQIATFVLEGDVMFVVTVLNDDPDGGEARQQELARKALDRLP